VGNFGNRQRNMRWGGELRGAGENEDDGTTSNSPSRNPSGSFWTLASNRQEPQIQDRTVRRGEHSGRQHSAPARNRFSDMNHHKCADNSQQFLKCKVMPRRLHEIAISHPPVVVGKRKCLYGACGMMFIHHPVPDNDHHKETKTNRGITGAVI
jgi:hypothetical protein